MTRRLEAGPLLVSLGAVLLLVSLFLDWYTGGVTAWDGFEVWDVVLLVLALGAILAGLGLLVPALDLVDRRWLLAAVAAVAVIVASQILDPPPAAALADPDTGAWLALAAAAVMCAGAVLTFSRVRFAVTVEGRDPRRHVAAVDARRPPDAATGSHPVVAAPASSAPADGEGESAARRLFSRERPGSSGAAARTPRTGARAAPGSSAPEAGDPPPEPKQDG